VERPGARLRRSAAPPSLAEQPRCSLDGRRAAAAPPTALSSTSHTGKPAALDVERRGARLRRSAAPPSCAALPCCALAGRRAAAAPPTALSSTSPTRDPAALDVERPGARLRRSAAPPSLAEQPRCSLDGRRAAAAPPTALSSTN